MVRFAALTAGFYRSLLARRVPEADARRLTANVTRNVYRKMAAVPGPSRASLGRRPTIASTYATELFRAFPFGPPSYDMVDVAADTDVVAFDVRRCPVAEYFRTQGLSRLCSDRVVQPGLRSGGGMGSAP